MSAEPLPRVEVPAIYVRVSTKGQEQDGTSLTTQEAACRAFCAERGWPVDEALIFPETFSGGHLWERPAMSALRAAVRAGQCTVIVSYAVDRLSREQDHLGLIVSECEHHGARLAFVTEDWDTSPLGKFMRGATAFAAELERAKILERTTRGRRQRVVDGKPLGGKRPAYGYQWNADHTAYLAHPDEAPVVRRIFAAVAEGATLRGLALELTRERVQIPWPTAANRYEWAARTVQRMVRSPLYWGEPATYRHATVWRTAKDPATNETRRYKTSVLRPADEWATLPASAVPALVSTEVAELARERLTLHRAHHGPTPTYPLHLLQQGFGVCGVCGGPLTVRHTRGRRPNYQCVRKQKNTAYPCTWHRMSAPVLDAEVWERVAQALDDPAIILGEVEARKRADTTAADLVSLERRLAEIAEQQANLARMARHLTDADAAAPLLADLSQLAEQKRKLEHDRDELVTRSTQRQAARQRLTDLATALAGPRDVVRANLASLPLARRRDALLALDIRVKLYPASRVPRWELDGEIPLLGTPLWRSSRSWSTPRRMRSSACRCTGCGGRPSVGW
jgi:site-specific DNA recombinase